MPWHRRATARSLVLKDRVTAAFAKQHTTEALEVADQITALHGVGAAAVIVNCCPACSTRWMGSSRSASG